MMDEFVDIEVITRDGREIARGKFRTPVSIGRAAGNDVRLDNDNISRLHASIALDGQRIRLTDSSMNGTFFRGQRIPQGQAVTFDEAGGQFEILDFVIRVKKAKSNPNMPVLFDAAVFDNVKRPLKRFPIGELMIVGVFKGSLKIEALPTDADFDTIFGRYRIDGRKPLFCILADQGRGMLVLSDDGVAIGVKKNRSEVRQQSLPLVALDVIELGDIRIELLPQSGEYLRCNNPKCELLNPYHRHDNCKFCGFRLVNGHTVIRPQVAR
jgi:hypothetical protein